ncbi:hypothetical protein [Prosthecobacter fluviatilis]|uniref:Uncharacterized protein n=1 Tax=Prosthecobacter fluviatilis TaxID=445931 RepID=A0ABW0KSG1_9BACT
MPKNLILTANYAGRKLEMPKAFLRSLRATGCQADVVLIANHGSAADRKHLAALMPAARLWVPIPKQRYRIFRRLATTFPSLARLVARKMRHAWQHHPERRVEIEHKSAYLLNITCSRYFLARQFLLQVGDRYDHVMLADSRDVVFQRDPFEGLPSGLTTGLESGLVRDQPGNCEWLQHLYGDDPSFPMADVMAEKVICSGVTLGDTASISSYLKRLCAEFMDKLPRMIHHPYLDQGVHIGLLRTGQISGVRLTSNGEDCIATLCTSNLSEFTFGTSSGLLAANGQPVRIVHQYDRHADLADKLLSHLLKG